MRLRLLTLALAVLLPTLAAAEEDANLLERFSPGREAGTLRANYAADYILGNETDIAQGLVYSGWTYNDEALTARYFGTNWFGGFLSLQRFAYTLYEQPVAGGPRQVKTSGGLFNAAVGPSARYRLGHFNFEGTVGYAFAQLPEFNNSADAVLTRAPRHALFGQALVQYGLPLGMVVEGRGTFPVSLSTTVPGMTGGKSSGFSAGAAFLVWVFSLESVSFRLGLDYTYSYDRVTATTPTLLSESRMHHVGIALEAVLGGPIPPPPTGALKVRVVTREGAPLAGAVVRLESKWGLPTTVTTGDDGSAHVEGLRTGTWTATATVDKLPESSADGEVQEGAERVLSVTMLPPPPVTGTVKVVVVDAASNSSLNHAVVKGGGLTQPVGEDGTLEIKDVKPGPFMMRITAPGYRPGSEAASVLAGQTSEVVVKLFKEAEIQPATLTGFIRSTQGEPVAATLQIPKAKLTVQADAHGTFAIKVAPGRYQVTISAPGYVSQTKNVTLRPGDEAIFNVNLFPRRN